MKEAIVHLSVATHGYNQSAEHHGNNYMTEFKRQAFSECRSSREIFTNKIAALGERESIFSSNK